MASRRPVNIVLKTERASVVADGPAAVSYRALLDAHQARAARRGLPLMPYLFKEPLMIATLMQVLVHLDSTPASALQLQSAREVAGQHGAALAALYAVSSTMAETAYADDMSGAVAQTMAEIDAGRRAQARGLHVLRWGGGEDELTVEGSQLSLDGYLRLHGVNAFWHMEGGEPADIGELMLPRVADLGGDLLVMGCYGYSRAREQVMGGASHAVLRSMTVPVLMAH